MQNPFFAKSHLSHVEEPVELMALNHLIALSVTSTIVAFLNFGVTLLGRAYTIYLSQKAETLCHWNLESSFLSCQL